MTKPTQPLVEIRVLDLTIFWAGPLPSAMLADMGAEVIKVEGPARLDPFRAYGVPADAPAGLAYECSPLYNAANRNKRAITLNLGDERGRSLCKRLVAKCDVVISNFSPRVLPQFGLDYEALRAIKPSIILTSISGFGASGPWRDYVSFAAIGEALSGLSSLTGYEGEGVLLNGVGVSDPFAGITAAFATLAAIHEMRRTGVGRHIEVSQLEASLPFIADALMEYSFTGRVRGRATNDHPYYAPNGSFPARGKDAWITISIQNDAQWQALVEVLGRPEWAAAPEFATTLGRLRSRDRIHEHLALATAAYDKYELTRELQRRGVPAAPVVYPSEQLSSSQLSATGFFQQVDHPYAGRHPYPAFPARFDGVRPPIKRVGPLAGEDNSYVFGELLGISEDEFARLEEAGVTGKPRL
jgi:crotonobetainyl-CoA:carnitine CoA-transferase CaiB-like acyl-CoA transferase